MMAFIDFHSYYPIFFCKSSSRKKNSSDDRVELLLQPSNFVHYIPETNDDCLPEDTGIPTGNTIHHTETPLDGVIEYHDESSTINLEPTRFSFTCHICQKSFISETSYRKHELIHNSKHYFKLR